MAITLISEPGEFQPANNPIVFVFSSNNSSQCEFNYILELYVNDVYAIKLKAIPDADGNGTFDISKVLQNYLTYDFNPGAVVFTPKPNSIVNYHIDVRERYNTDADCLGEPTLQAVDYTSSTKHAWNGALSYKGYTTYTQGEYDLVSVNSKPLTLFPDNLLITTNDSFTISVIQQFSFNYLELVTYDSSNNVIDTYYLSNPYTSPSSPYIASENLLQVGVGPRNINTIVWDGSPAPTQPIIDSSVKYYEITFLVATSPRDPISITKRFEIDTRCTRFDNYRLWWLNRLGEFDSYNFNLKSKRRVNVSRNTHTKLLANDYAIGDRGKAVTSVQADEVYTVNSNWMTEAEALWLEDLFTSPEVRIYTQSAEEVIIPVVGLFYVGGYLSITIDGTVNVGDEFSGDPTGLSNFGITGPITGVFTEDLTGGTYKTDILAPIDPGMGIISGRDLTVNTYTAIHIPIILLDNSYEEKIKKNTKNINYTLQFTPSYSLNIQSL
jgi:hypothetical protein